MDALFSRLREAEDSLKEQASQHGAEVQRLTGRCEAAEAEASRLSSEAKRLATEAEGRAKEREVQAVKDFLVSRQYSDAIAEAKAEAKTAAIDEFKVSEEFARVREQVVNEYKCSDENRASHRSFSQAAYNDALEVAASEFKEKLAAKYPELDLSFLEEHSDDEEEDEDDEELGSAAPSDADKAKGVPFAGIDPEAVAAEVVETEAAREEPQLPLELPSASKTPPADVAADPPAEASEPAESAETFPSSSSNPEQVL